MHDTVTDPKFNFYFGGCFQQHWKLSIPASYATSEAICFFMMIALIVSAHFHPLKANTEKSPSSLEFASQELTLCVA